MKYKITFEKLTEMIKEKINKKINNGKKLEYQPSESVFYPFEDTCNSFQEVWLSDTELIKIEYKNIEKWWKDRKDAQNSYENKNTEDVFIFQEIDDSEPAEILIKFKYENILQVLNILITYIDTSTSSKKNFSVKFNNKNLEIYPAEMGVDKDEDTLGGYLVIVEEYKFIETIKKNIKDENTISIITKDWDDFSAISGLVFHYESYDYDEDYLSDKEYNRLEKIKIEKKKYNR